MKLDADRVGLKSVPRLSFRWIAGDYRARSRRRVMQSSTGICCVAAALFVAAMCAQPALAQEYPTRPLRLVTGAPGGANDFITRVIAQGLSAGLGPATGVQNKPQGGLGGEAGAKC